ncbi:glutamate 5-kinase [Thermoactinomyces mirandus]|uniref:Glutamate 5-kinase n=1 Tax=Thermoactinomyces mirandus TaxID=2756294 RepID=A0A7W1XSN1_9BACL|nr:glutamate 5-kinase [Thermoactinomyces mirandus]MBA4602499.1 glutamate 5-kinase [Thermoactinomyces mirandus]
MRNKRIVVKVGSSSLTEQNGTLSEKKTEAIVRQISQLRQLGIEVILVSSGAVAAGMERLGLTPGCVTIPEKQAAAAVGQGALIDTYQKYFQQQGMSVGQLLLTRLDLEDRKRFIHIRNTLETLIKKEVIPIVNENDTVAVDEIRVGDNDTLSSLVAIVAEANLLIMLTDIDGLYTEDPRKDPRAKKIDEVHAITPELEKIAGDRGSIVGTGGMRTKLIAAKIAVRSGMEVVIASSNEPEILRKILQGKKAGTHFFPQSRLPSKKSWLAFSTRAEGKIIIDQGAKEALVRRHGSLLLGGIIDVSGTFLEGAIVEISDPFGYMIGKGMTSFSSSDLHLLLERRAWDSGHEKIHEVVHRDMMVIMEEEENVL